MSTHERTIPRPTPIDWILRSGLRHCLAIWLLQRVLLQTIGAVVVAVAGGPSSSYLRQACDGGSGIERIAFFPLSPMLARLVAARALRDRGARPGRAHPRPADHRAQRLWARTAGLLGVAVPARGRWYWIALGAGEALLLFNTAQLALGNWAD